MKKAIMIISLALLGGLFFQVSAQVVRDSLEFDKAAAVTPAELLRGHVAGLRVSAIDNSVNGALNTNIRGINELRGDSQPLWIVNGVQLNSSLNRNLKPFWQYGEKGYASPQNPLAFLNPYDIESIEVIKDLAATAVYGSAGANGVIIIRTKMPVAEEQLIRWDSNVEFSQPSYASDFFSTSISHNHSVSVSGTRNNSTYNISGFFRDVNGAVEGTGNTYAGLNVNFETHANSVVWFGLNSNSSMGNLSSTSGTACFGAPSMMMAVRQPDLFPLDTAEGWLADYDDDATDYRTINSVYLTLNFTPWLSLRTSIGVDLQNNNRYIWYGNGTSFGNEMNGVLGILASSMFNYNGESVLTANGYFGSGSHISANVGVEVFGEINKFNTMNGADFFSHELRAKGLSIAASKAQIHKYRQTYSREAAFAKLSYDWKSVAGIDAVFRADYTRKYFDNNPVLYPAAEAWLDVRKALFADSDVVSALKLKGGFGKAGRERYVPYGLFGEYCSGAYPAIDLEHETFYDGLNTVRSEESNAGIEIGLLKGRIKMSGGFYDKKSVDAMNLYCFGKKYSNSDIWHYVDRTDVFGFSSTIANRGLEFSLDARLVDSQSVKWSVFANAAYNVNQIIELSAEDQRGKVIGDDFFANVNALGWQAGSNYGFRVDESGEKIDLSRDGKISETDKEILGNPIPKLSGGAGTTVSAFGLTLDVIFDGAAGFSVFNLNKLVAETSKPYLITEDYVEKGDYVRLSRVSLSYDLPLGIKWIKEPRLKISGCNLLTLTDYSGWTPDVNSFGISNLSCGLDYGSHPLMRSIIVGISAKF